MIINGVDISALIRIRQINRQLAPSIENQIFDIPGRHGAYHIRNLRKLRRIEVDYAIVGEDVADRIEKAHQLAGLLATEDDLTIVLPDEPNRVYIGSLSGETDLDEVRHTAQGVLVFVCADPDAYDLAEQRTVITAPSPLFQRDSTAYLPNGTVVSANRPRFVDGQALLIEEGTENAIFTVTSYTNWLSNIPIGDYSDQSAGGGTVRVTRLGQHHFRAEALTDISGTPSLFITSGFTWPADQPHTISCIIHDYYEAPGTTAPWGLGRTTSGSGDLNGRDGLGLKSFTYSAGSEISAGLGLRSDVDATIAEGSYIEFSFPQIELGRHYATTFIDGAREPEILTLPAQNMFPSEGTVELWLYETGQDLGREAILFDARQSANRLYLERTADRLPRLATLVSGASYSAVGYQPLEPGWRHIAGVWKQGELHVYVDGELVASNIDAALPGTFNTAALGSTPDGFYTANTMIGGLRISSRAKTAEEIAAAYQSGRPFEPDPATSYLLSMRGTLDARASDVIVNDGTAETYPKFTITFTEQTTHFEILNHDLIDPATGTPQAIRLGTPGDIEQTPVDPLTLVLHDTMGSTSEWQAGVSVDGGVIAGQMASDGTKFYASDFGTGSDWHGPALRRILASPVQDFIMEARVQLNNLIGQSGRVEIYLFDQNDQVIGKIAIKDSKANSQLNYVEARAGGLAGGTYFIAEAGDNPGVWNNFDGVLRLERNGARWQAYVAKIAPDGTHYARRTRYLTDSLGQYMNALASVQVHIAAGGEYEPTEMSISELRVYRINQVQEEQEVPYIAYPGDVIEIDCGLNRVTRNGAVANQIIALENRFFPLRVGQNTLELFPKGAAEVEVSWRRRWV